MKVLIIEAEDYPTSIYITKEWEQSVKIVNWEHNYETNQYIIKYEEKLIK